MTRPAPDPRDAQIARPPKKKARLDCPAGLARRWTRSVRAKCGSDPLFRRRPTSSWTWGLEHIGCQARRCRTSFLVDPRRCHQSQYRQSLRGWPSRWMWP